MKHNIETHYSVIGVLEHKQKSLAILEAKFPDEFKGLTLNARRQVRLNRRPYFDGLNINNETELRTIYCQRMPLDCQIYDFVVERLLMQYEKLTLTP